MSPGVLPPLVLHPNPCEVSGEPLTPRRCCCHQGGQSETHPRHPKGVSKRLSLTPPQCPTRRGSPWRGTSRAFPGPTVGLTLLARPLVSRAGHKAHGHGAVPAPSWHRGLPGAPRKGTGEARAEHPLSGARCAPVPRVLCINAISLNVRGKHYR